MRSNLVSNPVFCLSVVFMVALLGTRPSWGQVNSKMLVTAEALQTALRSSRLEDQPALILDVRKESEYAAGHIPGAVWLDIAAWKKQGQQPGGFQDATAWSKLGSAIGLEQDRAVIVYGAAPPDAGRCWWLLKYLGIAEVKILDGGWGYWVASEGPVSQQLMEPSISEFKPQFDRERLVEIDEMLKCVAAGKTQILDTRSLAEFEGDRPNGGNAGRIPGSAHLDWTQLVGEDGRFKSPAELQQLLDATGFALDQPIITYCASGGRATVDAFVIEYLGYPKVRVYSRSFEEWGATEEAPKQKGKKEPK